jgi:GNAT superfamily N-acetyltransferase
MLRLFKSSKVAPSPEAPPTFELHVWTHENAIWQQFADNVEATNESIEYTTPGLLSIELAELCRRNGAGELDSQKIMYFSEATNYFLELKKNGKRIGFLLLECYTGSLPAKIWLVCISSSEKGKNYSKLLIDQAKEIARGAGKRTIHLEAITREVGRKVYKPLGFKFNYSNNDNDMTADLNTKVSATRKNRKGLRKNRSTRR